MIGSGNAGSSAAEARDITARMSGSVSGAVLVSVDGVANHRGMLAEREFCEVPSLEELLSTW